MDLQLRTLERAAKTDPQAAKQLESHYKRLADSGDLSALAKLYQLRRTRRSTGYGITCLIHDFIENHAPARSYTGHHDKKEFRIRLEYGGSLIFLYQDGKLAVTGGYLPGWAYHRYLEKLAPAFEVVGLEQMPEVMQLSIRRYDGWDVRGVVIDMDNDLKAFEKIKSLIHCRFGTQEI